MSRPASAARYRCQTSVFSSQRQLVEAVGVQLHDRRIVDLLEDRAYRCVRRLGASLYSGRSTFCPCAGISYSPSELFRDARLQALPAPRFRRARDRSSSGARGNVRSHRMISLGVGMRRHAVDLLYSRVDRHVLPEASSRTGRAVHQLPSARAGRLEADEQHGVARVRQPRRQVVHDAAAGGHAARRR